MTAPLVTVVTPAYMAADFIEETMRSVWQQTYRPIEHIVVVDASPDATGVRAARLCDEMSGDGYTVRVIEHSVNTGTSGALNTAVAAASGDYVAWLSADDLYVERGKTSRQVALLASQTGVAGVYDSAMLTGPDLQAASVVHPRFPRFLGRSPGVGRNDPTHTLVALLFANPINGTSIMLRRRMMPETEWFDPALGNYAQDGDLWLRMQALGLPLVPSDGVGTLYRAHSGQHSHHSQAMNASVSISQMRLLSALADHGRLTDALETARLTLGLGVADRAYRRRPAPFATLRGLLMRPSISLRTVLAGMLFDIDRRCSPAEREEWRSWEQTADEYRSSEVFQNFERALSRTTAR